jgi:diamine N-acetyltransferase
MKQFRPATVADTDAIMAMMRRYYAEDGYSFDEDEGRNAVLELMRNENLGRLWVAHDQGAVVGYLAVTLGFSLEYRGRDAFIDELFILEDRRGLGLGREALRIAEAYCRRMGVRALHLEVEEHRETALELYRRAGYEDHGRRLMTKWLNPGVKPLQ